MSDALAAMIDQTFARALALHQAGKPAMAEAIYRMVLNLDPQHGPATDGLLVARMHQGDRGAAQDYLARCWATGRTGPEPYLMLALFEQGLGVAAQSQGRLDLARAHFARAQLLAPELAEGLRRLGTVTAQAGAVEAGVALLERAARLAPADPEPLRTLGEIMLATDAPARALPWFERALAIRDGAEARVGLGRARLMLGDPYGGLEAFERAVDLDPGLRGGWLGVVQALVALGRADDAAGRLDAMALRFAGRADDLLQICTEYLDLGREAEALETYRAVVAAAANPARFPGAGPRVLRRRRVADLCAERGWPYHRVAAPHRATYIDDTGARHDAEFPELFLARVDGAEIVTSTWAVACGDALLVHGLVHFDPDSLLWHPEFPWTSPEGRVLVDLEPPGAVIEGEAILLGGVANWAHLVQEYFSRLTVLERFPELDHLPILVMPKLMRSIRELAGLLGIDPARLVELPETRVVRAERLWIPSLTHRHQHASPLHLDFLRRRLSPLIAEGMRAPRRRLYLSRRTAGWRTLVNEAAVLEALAPLGVEVVVPEDFSMADQVRLFASAELVVGPLGGASAAIIFAPPGAGFVELTHGQLAIPQYGMLTATLHQRYRRVIGPTLGNRGPTSYDFDFSVPPEDVAAACRAVLEGA